MINTLLSDAFQTESHTTIAYLKRHPAYLGAKNGNLLAARQLVADCVKPERLDAFRRRYHDATLLPLRSGNMLPLALAMELDMPICDSLFVGSGNRKEMNAMQRLLHTPRFFGQVAPGKYLLVDDVLTTGGTLKALGNHLMHCGGVAVAAMVLAFAAGSRIFLPETETLFALYQKFGSDLPHILHFLALPPNPDALTNAQISYLLRFSSAKQLYCRATKTKEAYA